MNNIPIEMIHDMLAPFNAEESDEVKDNFENFFDSEEELEELKELED